MQSWKHTLFAARGHDAQLRNIGSWASGGWQNIYSRYRASATSTLPQFTLLIFAQIPIYRPSQNEK